MDWFEQIAEEVDLPVKRVKEIYMCYWKCIKDIIQNLPLKKELTQEQFNALKVNFNIPLIGKFNCNYERVKRVKNSFKKSRIKNDNIKKD